MSTKKDAMSNLRCSCGYVISDVLIPSETEGNLLRQQDDVFSEAAAKIAAFCTAARAGKRGEWIASDLHEYAHDLPDEDVIHDILAAYWLERALRVCECGGCGRLWVQEQPGMNRYMAFSPDESGMRGILRSPFHKPKAT